MSKRRSSFGNYGNNAERGRGNVSNGSYSHREYLPIDDPRTLPGRDRKRRDSIWSEVVPDDDCRRGGGSAGSCQGRGRRGETRDQRGGPRRLKDLPAYEPSLALQALSVFMEACPEYCQADKALFLRADYTPLLFDKDQGEEPLLALGSRLLCAQSAYAAYERLRKAGVRLTAPADRFGTESQQDLDAELGTCDLCLFLGTNQREENLACFGRGILSLKPGGIFLCALPNDWGAQRYEKMLASFHSLEVQYSKYHSRVFGIKVPLQWTEEERRTLEEWRSKGSMSRSQNTGFVTCPGQFGWDKEDEGSRLLVDYLTGAYTSPEAPATREASGLSAEELAELPRDERVLLRGAGADIGSGYGYLSVRLLEHLNLFPKVESLSLYEQEGLALECARRNLQPWINGEKSDLAPALEFHWGDVLQLAAARKPTQYNWILMNPPFHQSKDRCLELGQRFIEAAARFLKPGGQLLMVANRCLLYEPILRGFFKRVTKAAETNKFTVYRAWR